MAYANYRNNRNENWKAVRAGTTAGLIAGSVMALVLMVASAASGMGFWFPLQLIGATFFGVPAILGGVSPTVTGAIFHLVWSAILGGLFAPLVRPSTSTFNAIGGGIVFGIFTWAAMTYLVLPWADATLSERMALAPTAWFLSHLVFGAILGCTPALLRAQIRGIREQGAERDYLRRAA